MATKQKWFTDEFAEKVWQKKYAGKYLNIDVYLDALAWKFAGGDANFSNELRRLFDEKKFIFGGRILALAGNPDSRSSAMNCTSHKVEDDTLESIAETAYTIMRASSRGQGIGSDLSKLRPKDAPVNNAASTSTGAISFMEMLSTVSGTIGQNGRRAALLFSLDVSHPDIWRPGEKDVQCPACHGKGCLKCDGEGYLPYDFLHVKNIPGKVETANISVNITDEFMRAVEADAQWELFFEGESSKGPFRVSRTVPARALFKAIAKNAWRSAEPGLLFQDTARFFSNSDLFDYPVIGVNACSEQVLDQDGVCLLGQMNLGQYVVNPFTDNSEFDFENFEKDVAIAVRSLDNVINVELSEERSISDTQRESLINLRRIGLGVMGLADMLAMLGCSYSNNEKTLFILHRVFSAFRDASYKASIDLAKRFGPAPIWRIGKNQRRDIIKYGFYSSLPADIKEEIIEHGMRNVCVTSIAPTGSVANLMGAASGVEPLFALEYTRMTRISGKDEHVNYVHPGVAGSRAMGKPDSIWDTAYTVSPDQHVHVQAFIQQYIDSSIAKTTNLPSSATVEDVEDIYMLAWKLGCKGITVYRDGSRHEQVLTVKDKKEEEKCPVCGSELTMKEGCVTCESCGEYGKCV